MGQYSRIASATMVALLLTAALAIADFAEIWTALQADAALYAATVGPDGTVFWVGAQGKAVYLVRHGADGDRAFRKKVGKSAKLELYAVAVSADSATAAIGGGLGPGGTPDRHPWVAMYTADKGKKLWVATLDDFDQGQVSAAAIASDGSVYVAGAFAPFEGFADRDLFVARFDATGSLLWAETYRDAYENHGDAIAIDPKGKGVYVGGRVGDFEGPPYLDTLLLMYGPDGELVWEQRRDGTGAIDAITSILVSGNGKKLFLAGYTDVIEDEDSRELFYQQAKTKNGKAKRWKLHDLAGGFESNASLASRDGKTFFLAASGCEPGFDPCTGYLLKLNGKGGQLDRSAVVRDLETAPSDTAEIYSLGVAPDGNPVVAGAVIGNGSVTFLRKLMQ
jgi:hypothetical protein